MYEQTRSLKKYIFFSWGGTVLVAPWCIWWLLFLHQSSKYRSLTRLRYQWISDQLVAVTGRYPCGEPLFLATNPWWGLVKKHENCLFFGHFSRSIFRPLFEKHEWLLIFNATQKQGSIWCTCFSLFFPFSILFMCVFSTLEVPLNLKSLSQVFSDLKKNWKNDKISDIFFSLEAKKTENAYELNH